MKQILLFLLIAFSVVGCIDNRSGCISRNIYPDLDLTELKTGEKKKQEGVFELVELSGRLQRYKRISGDTIEATPEHFYQDGNRTLNQYIDSLNKIGFVFEMYFNRNNITDNAMEPAIQESVTTWYFVEYEDSNKVVRDLVEAILPIDSKTEAYIAAVSSVNEYDLFWLYEEGEIEPSITTTGQDAYRLNLPYNISYCEPQQLGLLNLIVNNDGSFLIVENFEDYRTIDCKCN